MKDCCTPMILLVLVALVLSSGRVATGSVGAGPFEAMSPQDAGLSDDGLDALVEFCEEAGSAALLILYDGKVVLSWGEVGTKYPVHSIRKALLNSLYGIHVERGDIDLDMMLEELGIDDIPPALSAEEKQATVRDLIGSRSGVYHIAAAESQEMMDTRAERGSHAPGSFFYYNNWDFNVLGTIFRQQTGRDIFEAFYEEIAKPIGMKDFSPDDGFYMYEEEKSLHPAYHFQMTALDMALYGLLYMNDGSSNGKQIVPADWIAESTKPRSLMLPEIGLYYGYLWYALPEMPGLGRTFLHTGVGVHMLAVCPGRNMVIVHRVDTRAEDVRFTSADLRRLLGLLIAALSEGE